MTEILLRSLLALALAVAAVPLHAAELSGRVTLLAKGGKKPARGAEANQTVVYFEPSRPVAVRPAPEPLLVRTEGKEFLPRVLPVTRGSQVRFPNRDPILHNVFSVSRGNRFDLGLYGKGEGEATTLDQAGVVQVFCNVHRTMVAFILVLETPYFAMVDEAGEFRLSGLPQVPGRLTVWHPQTEPWTTQLDVGPEERLSVRLEVVRPRVPSHLNKRGKRYKGGRRGRYP